MWPILFTLGPVAISSFGVLSSLAFVFLAYGVWRSLRDSGVEDEKIFDNLIITVTAGLIGARFYYVLTHWELFSGNALYIPLLWLVPGLSWWGFLSAAILAIFFVCSRQKLSIALVADAYGRALPMSTLFLSLAVHFDGSVKGTTTSWIVGMRLIGETGLRHPVGLYTAFFSLLVGLGGWLLLRKFNYKNIPKGVVAWVVLALIGLAQLLLAFVRSDLLYLQAVPVDGAIATILIIMPLVPLFSLLNGKKWLATAGERIKNIRRPKNSNI